MPRLWPRIFCELFYIGNRYASILNTMVLIIIYF